MRRSVRGWRSARHWGTGIQGRSDPALSGGGAGVVAGERVSVPATMPQQAARFSLGLVALIYYLWVIHSYKTGLADLAPAGLLVGVLVRGGTLRIPAPLKVMGLLVLWSSLGLAVTMDQQVTLDSVLTIGKLWVILFCLMNIVRNAADLRIAVIAWLGVYALYPLRGAYYNQFICHCTEFGRVAWNFIFANPNDLAALSMMPLGMAGGMVYVERVKVWRLAAIAGVAALTLLIMLTQSRGAMLGVGFATVLLILGSRRKGRDLFILLAVFAVAAVLAPRGVWTRLAGLTNVSVQSGMQGVDPEGSAEARWQIWGIAAHTIRENPVFGVGAGMMPAAHLAEARRRNAEANVQGARDTHSTYLRLAAETGIPGLAIYLTMWGVLFHQIRRVRRKIAATRTRDSQFLMFLELSLAAFSVTALFGTFGWVSFTYLMIGMAWLAASILEHETWYVPPSAQRRAA